MQINVSVRSEENSEFEKRNGRMGRATRISCLDEDTAAPFKNTFDYELTEDEVGKYATKLVGKRIVLGVTDAQVFNGRLRVKGGIIKVDGVAANGKA